ncbi:hypothetical protein NCPPB940_19790 [Xanthomonas hortorum pv. taraxaci]|nr:hypothetical protein NCPPB940_19790 [Xanthomonas hortorum pv. taraxaci]CAD0327173.1 hypothetical protein NCPPB940_19790 [Xanthomonas hortorum pv. taraxaci]
MARSEADQSTRRRSLSYSHQQQPVVLACVPAWDLMRHGMLQKSLQRCTCGVSHAGTRASTLSNRAFRTKPADFMCAVDRSAVPYPVSGHAVNPSVEAQWRHPCRHMVPQSARTPHQRVCRLLYSKPCIPTIPTGPCPPTVAGPYAAWTPRKSLHGRTCGVSREGGRARTLQQTRRSAALQVIYQLAMLVCRA